MLHGMPALEKRQIIDGLYSPCSRSPRNGVRAARANLSMETALSSINGSGDSRCG